MATATKRVLVRIGTKRVGVNNAGEVAGLPEATAEHLVKNKAATYVQLAVDGEGKPKRKLMESGRTVLVYTDVAAPNFIMKKKGMQALAVETAMRQAAEDKALGKDTPVVSEKTK